MSLPFGILINPTSTSQQSPRTHVARTWSIEQRQYQSPTSQSSASSSSSRSPSSNYSDSSSTSSASMFTSLRHKLSKNGPSGKEASHVQARNVAPATRRPPPKNNDPPPAYTEYPAPSRPAPTIPGLAVTTNASAPAPTAPCPLPNTPASTQSDSAYSFLSTFDTILIIDDSGSMAGGLWNEACTALATITPLCTAHDADGIDIHFLNHPTSYTNITSPGTVHEIFTSVRPGGSTPTGQRLHRILRSYLREFEARPETTKPINIICITDGAPSDDVESPLISAAKKLDKLDAPAWQVGVQFFQVGSDPEATRHLQSLDDELAEIAGDDEMRDLVDTVPFAKGGRGLTGEGILKVVLGAVTRRLDRRGRGLHE